MPKKGKKPIARGGRMPTLKSINRKPQQRYEAFLKTMKGKK